MILLIGSTCSGKSTVAKELEYLGYKRIIEVTTRQPRPGEQNGVDYWFKTNEEFDELEQQDKLLGITKFKKYEKDKLNVVRYGILKEDIINADKQSVLTTNIAASLDLKQFDNQNNHTYNIFLVCLQVDPEEQMKRLINRGGDSPEEFKIRIKSDTEKLKDVEEWVNYITDNSYALPMYTAFHIAQAYAEYTDNIKECFAE